MTSVYLAPWRIDVVVRDTVVDAHGGRRPIAFTISASWKDGP